MSDLRFDTEEAEFGRPRDTSGGFDLTGKLIEWGLVSDRQTAGYALIATAVVALLGAYFLYGMISGGSDVPSTPVYGVSQR